MNIFAMAIASTFNSQRKYLRWHLKVLAFFTGVIDKNLYCWIQCGLTILVDHFTLY